MTENSKCEAALRNNLIRDLALLVFALPFSLSTLSQIGPYHSRKWFGEFRYYICIIQPSEDKLVYLLPIINLVNKSSTEQGRQG